MNDFEFNPKEINVSTEGGYRVPNNLYKLGKACDEWLQKRYALEGRKSVSYNWSKGNGRAPETEVQRLARAIRTHTPKQKRVKAPKAPKAEKPPKPIKVPRERKPAGPRKRNRAKYATLEERKAAIAAAVAAQWASMTPAERAERHKKMIGARKPKSDVPRHKRESWRKYKREYDRERRKTQVLSPEQIEKRRADARRQYAARDPERRKAQAAKSRERFNAKRKAQRQALKAAA